MARIGENTPVPPEDILYHSNEYQVESRPQEGRAAAEHEERVTIGVLTGSSSLELLAAGAAIVLAIVGLTGTLALCMCAIATIAIGVALFAHGATVAVRLNDTLRRVAPGTAHRVEVASSVGSEVLGGVAGIVLGVLALANIQPLILLPVAAIVFGGAILLGAPAQPDIAGVAFERDDRVSRLTVQAVEVTSGALVLAGVGALVLGILGLLCVAPPLTLSLVAMLTLGSALLLVGGALATRFATRFARILRRRS